MEEEKQEPRGVFNPRVVDLISYDEEAREVVLLMLEERSWDSGPEQLRQLEEKFNAYLGYVLDGHMVKQYPQYAGVEVAFRLECAEAPRDEARRMIQAMQNFAAAESIRFEVRLIRGTPDR